MGRLVLLSLLVYPLDFKETKMTNEGKKRVLFLIFLCGFFAFASAASLKKDLSISLVDKKIQDINGSGLILVFSLNISSSSSSFCYLSRYDYRVVVNQAEYLNLQTSLDRPIEIAAKGNTLISLPIKITYSLLFQSIKGIEDQDKALCYLTGGLVFLDERKKEERIPIIFSGEFPIFKEPEIEFHFLQVRDLTIGGADLSLEVTFKNKNAFELLVDRISYKLALGEKPVGEGEIAGDKNIETRAEKTFSLPLLLDFFEIGKEVYNILLELSVPCRFSGEMEVTSVWGKIVILFDKSERISLSRVS